MNTKDIALNPFSLMMEPELVLRVLESGRSWQLLLANGRSYTLRLDGRRAGENECGGRRGEGDAGSHRNLLC